MVANGNHSELWPADSPAAIAHVNLLVGIINRLATQSASCKTWCITLVAALVSLAGATRVPGTVTVALVPVVIFGFLDTMYLAQERAYRGLYTRIVADIRDRTYALARTFEATASPTICGSLKAILSWSIWPVYGGLIATYVAARCMGWLLLLARPVTGS